MDFLIEAVLFFAFGFLFGRKNFFQKKEEQKNLLEHEEKEVLPIRNRFSVTKEKNPTFAEQWINIMNYCGENQMEGDYEETE